MNIKKEIKNYSDKELEIFVRDRLGQRKPELCEHGQEHLRFSFHTAKPRDIVDNAYIVEIFGDIWEADDHEHSPIFLGYKGSLMIGSTNFDSDNQNYNYSGLGTVEILMNVIRGWVDGKISCYNGTYIDKRNEEDN